MSKLKENVDPHYIICISRWWGLGKTPGSIGFFIYPEGRYIRKVIKGDYSIEGGVESVFTTEGVLSDESFSQLQSFVGENIKESKEDMVFDMGNSIEIKSETGVIEIKNDRELFRSLTEMIPFEEQTTETPEQGTSTS